MRPTSYVASFDSCTAMLRALARFLHGRDFPSTGAVRWASPERTMALVSALPRHAREALYSVAGWQEALRPSQLHRVDAEAVSRWMVRHYPRRQVPAVMLGSASGALVHLCAALGVPWLPQTYLIPVRMRVDADSPRLALARGRAVAGPLLAANPALQLHHMHDPSQDRLMVRGMGYFRVKRRTLGEAYTAFIEQVLPPGGTLFLSECEQRWPTTRVGPRHVFQFGAVGGTRPEEFLHGGPRVADYLARYGVPHRQWDAPEPDAEAPEAEWGFEPALREDVVRLARRRGYRVRRLLFRDPEDLSPLVADLYRWWYHARGLRAGRLVVESFIELEPYWVLRTGSVPFWMTFNMEGSADALERYLDASPPFDFLHLMLFQHGVDSPGLAPVERWRALLARARREGTFLGVDPARHPRDFASFVRYHTQLKALPSRYALPGPLPLRALDAFLAAAGERYPVRWREGAESGAPGEDVAQEGGRP